LSAVSKPVKNPMSFTPHPVPRSLAHPVKQRKPREGKG
jgi:hypothetical protein